MRCAICRYGSPQDGRSGSRSRSQLAGSAQERLLNPTAVPSKSFAASMIRSSVTTGSPVSAANGRAVSWARCSDDAAR